MQGREGEPCGSWTAAMTASWRLASRAGTLDDKPSIRTSNRARRDLNPRPLDWQSKTENTRGESLLSAPNNFSEMPHASSLPLVPRCTAYGHRTATPPTGPQVVRRRPSWALYPAPCALQGPHAALPGEIREALRFNAMANVSRASRRALALAKLEEGSTKWPRHILFFPGLLGTWGVSWRILLDSSRHLPCAGSAR